MIAYFYTINLMTYCYLQDIIIISENNRMMLCLIGIYKVKYCLMVYDIICIGEIFGIYFYDKSVDIFTTFWAFFY